MIYCQEALFLIVFLVGPGEYAILQMNYRTPMSDIFHRIAHRTAEAVGSPYTFAAAIALVLAWAIVGPRFGYSDTWQLVINTGTTILTFLMVFLIQNTQNRDGRAIQLKLDELIRSQKSARNRLLDLEDLPDGEMNELQEEFRNLREKARRVEERLAERRENPGKAEAPPK